MINPPQKLYEFGPFHLDPARPRLMRDGEIVSLTPKALEILLALIQNGGKVVEKDELMRKVWPDTFVEESNLSVHVFALRKALGETIDGNSYIETVPRQGYRFAATVRDLVSNGAELVVERHTVSRVTIEEREASIEVEPEKASVAVATASSSRPLVAHVSSPAISEFAHKSRQFQRRAVVIGVAIMLGLTSALVYLRLTNEAKAPQTSAEVKSLAVLPFRTLGAPKDEEYLGLGLADSLITQFAQTRQLMVRPTSAIGKYAEGDLDPLVIGRALGVEAVLEGNTQMAGERVRVTARLIRVSDGAALWAGKFDEKMTDIFTLQDSISRQVTEALGSRLVAAEDRLVTKRPTEDIKAYQLYLKGRYLWGGKATDGVKKAVEYFEQAIQLDPQFAQAYSGLADGYLALSEFGLMPREQAYSKANATAEKAISLDSNLAEAHTTMGFIRLSRDWDYANAEREFKRAIELNPNYSTAYQFYGVHLLAVGQTDAAIAQTRRALELDPLSILNNSQLARCLYLARRYDEAIEQGQKTLELDATSASAQAYLGQSYAHKGMLAEATAELEKSVEMSRERPEMKAALGYAYALSGNKDEVRQIIGELAALNRESSFVSYHIATIHAGLGEKEQALAWLERAYVERDIFMGVRLKTDPKLDNLRADPRFQNLLRQVGLLNS